MPLASAYGVTTSYATETELAGLTGCQVCGWTALLGLGLCIGCLEIREWSRINRAFCEFIHRGGEHRGGEQGGWRTERLPAGYRGMAGAG